MHPGQKIEIQFVDESGEPVPLANVLPRVTFFDGGHQYYVFDLRPTGSDGCTNVDFSELDTRRLEAALVVLMDYNTPLAALDPDVEISVPSEADLQQEVAEMNKWNYWTRPAWVSKWPVNGCLAPVVPKRAHLQGEVTHVDIVISLPKATP